MEFTYNLFNYFLPKTSHTSIVRHRKSAILVFSHLFVFLSLCCLLFLSKSIEKIALVPAFMAVPAVLASLFYFKKQGNTNFSGNILTVIWYVTLIPILVYTGGIHSSLLLWLYGLVFMTVMVERYFWSAFWFGISSLTIIGFYVAGRFFPHLNIANSTDTDTVISYITVGSFMFTNLVVFEKHQLFIIKILKTKNIELKNQKTEIANHAAELEKIQKQLTFSNKELQIFAHAASHDLKEPLRMISMYVQLLEKKMKDLLDDKTREYMFYTTDGVKRMQKLLDNLLAYSLLGKNGREVKLINLNEKLKNVHINLTVLIDESHASINFSSLPHIEATETEMAQLFQNLIANALKFRKPKTDVIININCIEEKDAFLFSISDNGIGIKTEDHERIFNIFTRLHNRSEYEGTGIGLATCQKIITHLGGKIWVESYIGVGTTFYFTIPKTELSYMDEVEKSVEKTVNLEKMEYA
jgi:signal transduction histidine kinase